MFDGLDPGAKGIFVPPGELPRWADRIRPHLEKMAAGSGGRYAAEDVHAELARGQSLLWVALDGEAICCVMTTQIIPYPRRRAMRCTGIVGHRPKRWMHLLAWVEKVSREYFGCDLMEALHQPGHARLLRTNGWREFHVLSEKVLT